MPTPRIDLLLYIILRGIALYLPRIEILLYDITREV